MRRRSTRKNKGGGCGCGGMEMLGFPKSGGFLSLFGGQDSKPKMMNSQNSQPMMKQSLPDVMSQNSQPMMKQSLPGVMSQNSQPMIQNSQPMMKPSLPMMKEASPQEIVGEDYTSKKKSNSSQEMSYPKGKSMNSSQDMSYPMKPRDTRRSMPSSEELMPLLEREFKKIKKEIQTLKNQISNLKSNKYSFSDSSPGLFGGRRKTLRRMRKDKH